MQTSAAAMVLIAALSSGAAQAAGCGGYVNIAVWGCAPWDNNPPKAGVTPGFRAPAPKPAPIARQPIAQPKPVVPTAGGRILTDGGAGLKPAAPIISDNSGGLKPRGAGVLSDYGLGMRR